jgi:hypothetical protein
MAAFKLVEECSGSGELIRGREIVGRVRYRVDRYQGMMEASGLPVPGLHRIEGSIEPEEGPISPALAGTGLTLRLADGRTVAVTLGVDGSVRAEGHGPGQGCSCC